MVLAKPAGAVSDPNKAERARTHTLILPRRLGWHMPQVDRVLDINHHSRLEQMDTALGALGCNLRVEVTDAA